MSLQPAPEPVDEPILVMLPDGEHTVVQPGTEAWLIAWAYREEKAARELAERDLRVKRAAITKLQEDQEAKQQSARDHFANRGVIEEAYQRWLVGRRERTGNAKLRAKLTPERFDMAMARMARDHYDAPAILMAAEGVARNPYTVDGVTQDDWKTAMQSGEQVERYANRCPREVRAEILAARPGDQMEIAGG